MASIAGGFDRTVMFGETGHPRPSGVDGERNWGTGDERLVQCALRVVWK